VGINFMVDQHFEDIRAEFSITEGGGGTLDGERVSVVNVGTAEKIPARARLVATGQSGHGSIPRLDNALIHLSAAVEKLGRWESPMRLNATTKTYFERLAAISPPDEAAIYRALEDPRRAPASLRYLAEKDPRRYSMLRTSIVPTMLKAGVGTNVIPSEAEATLDIRVLPDENIKAFYEEMNRVIADPAVKIVPLPPTRPAAPASSLDTDMYRALEQVSKAMYPTAAVLPTMSTGASDMAQLRAKGVQSYGIGPAVSVEDENYGAHSDVERLLETSLYKFVEFTWNAVNAVSAHK
jgi:acetylornithine deacetylase/succinyl-diaminopimelate desuccinylase-like protein